MNWNYTIYIRNYAVDFFRNKKIKPRYEVWFTRKYKGIQLGKIIFELTYFDPTIDIVHGN